MVTISSIALGLVFSYLLGCFCTGYYLTNLLSGENLGQIGSGSLGATNVSRILGKKGFIITFLFDFLKGILVAYASQFIVPDKIWIILFGITAVVGHIWPFQLNFSGGKGISTFLGIMLVFDYRVILSFIGIFLPIYLLIKRFSITGLIAISLSPLIVYLLGYHYDIILIIMLLIGVILIAHRTNIKDYFTLNTLR